MIKIKANGSVGASFGLSNSKTPTTILVGGGSVLTHLNECIPIELYVPYSVSSLRLNVGVGAFHSFGLPGIKFCYNHQFRRYSQRAQFVVVLFGRVVVVVQ